LIRAVFVAIARMTRMTLSSKYRTPDAFKQALEHRIRVQASAMATDISRRRQLCIFHRFLARIFDHFKDRVVLKGGVVLELRLERARTTRDVDLGVCGNPDNFLVELRRAGQLHLSDFLTFTVDPDPVHPTIQGDGIIYDGQRFRVQAELAGKVYGSSFGLDVVFGDRTVPPPEIILSPEFWNFAGLPVSHLRVYARETHLAEKLHALTMPRMRENSRIKDLPDVALLGMTGPFEARVIRVAIEATFGHRGTHPPPSRLPDPPTSWARPYARMAQGDNLPWPTIELLFQAVSSFVNPVLQGDAGTWDPGVWAWCSNG
jgi:hypothetical protein